MGHSIESSCEIYVTNVGNVRGWTRQNVGNVGEKLCGGATTVTKTVLAIGEKIIGGKMRINMNFENPLKTLTYIT